MKESRAVIKGEENRLFALSTVPVALMLLIHGIHLLLAPALAGIGLGVAAMHHAHQHEMDSSMAMSMPMSMPMSGASSSLSWLTALLVILNGIAIYCACRMLYRMVKQRETGRTQAARLKAIVSVLSILIGVATFVVM
ncbi:hypothetical protein [Paenibacillus sp. OV219]|uniref:hypothetical protein n=1 Tax=Paenibacillus sp. OV219 TaxID=1884377 RepID=UPI0008ADEA53|nr:hypothetical protein [Paenibacillus sp. OV219]SEM73785.1 hypothetical protein SAMN05518847_101661 [Paenibacillus sp. OV219]